MLTMQTVKWMTMMTMMMTMTTKIQMKITQLVGYPPFFFIFKNQSNVIFFFSDASTQTGKQNNSEDSDDDDYDDENEIEINSGKELLSRDKTIAEEIDGLNSRIGDCKFHKSLQ